MVRHGHRIPLEMMGTMIEIADVAWNALEHGREHNAIAEEEEEEIERLQSENNRLKTLLAEHVPLLHDISQVPSLAGDCPSDLYTRLSALVDSPNFLEALESLNKSLEAGSNRGLSCNTYTDPGALDGLIHADEGNLNRWVLVTHDMAPHYLEEMSGIDNENYVIISQENVVDGISNFIARCILENPKSKKISPQELQKAVSKALGDIKGRNKLKSLWDAGIVIYTLSTWGIFLAGHMADTTHHHPPHVTMRVVHRGGSIDSTLDILKKKVLRGALQLYKGKASPNEISTPKYIINYLQVLR